MKITKKYIDNVLNEAKKLNTAEGTITECIVSVAKNETNQKIYINHLNSLNDSLVKEELKQFKSSVHKIQMITRKGKTQKLILGDNKAKTHYWNIVICKQAEIDSKLATEKERGTYKGIEIKRPPVTKKAEQTPAEWFGDWIVDNKPSGLANPKRKAYKQHISDVYQIAQAELQKLNGK